MRKQPVPRDIVRHVVLVPSTRHEEPVHIDTVNGDGTWDPHACANRLTLDKTYEGKVRLLQGQGCNVSPRTLEALAGARIYIHITYLYIYIYIYMYMCARVL